VKFVKQNVGNVSEQNLKNQIKACQNERDRIDLLMCEYLNDKLASKTEHTFKSRRDALWNLVDDLINVFEMQNPLSHSLFQEYTPTELHHQGVERLITSYEKGLERIKAVYRQEVLEIECRNTRGRRKIEVIRTKFKDFRKQKKANRQVHNILRSQNTSQASNLELSRSSADDQTNSEELSKKKRRQTTSEEERILKELLVYEELPDSVIDEVLGKLSNDWNRTKVKAAWRYRKTKIISNK